MALFHQIRARWARYIVLFGLTTVLVVGSLAVPVQAYTAAQYQRMAREMSMSRVGPGLAWVARVSDMQMHF